MSRIILTTKTALFISFCVSALSFWQSMTLHDWNWFSRSGSLIVVIGILLTSTQIIENRQKLHNRKRHHDRNFERDFANNTTSHELDNSRHRDEDVWEYGLKGLYLLIVGTIIWGYGDLLQFVFEH